LPVVAGTLSEYESDVEALDDLLHWLVEGAVRLKALLADVSGAVGSSADSWTIPPGIMPPFPEKSSFGKVRQLIACLAQVQQSKKHNYGMLFGLELKHSAVPTSFMSWCPP
jgi:hypothetical protein